MISYLRYSNSAPSCVAKCCFVQKGGYSNLNLFMTISAEGKFILMRWREVSKVTEITVKENVNFKDICV